MVLRRRAADAVWLVLALMPPSWPPTVRCAARGPPILPDKQAQSPLALAATPTPIRGILKQQPSTTPSTAATPAPAPGPPHAGAADCFTPAARRGGSGSAAAAPVATPAAAAAAAAEGFCTPGTAGGRRVRFAFGDAAYGASPATPLARGAAGAPAIP
jgi:hypothetical protein